jgi:hypothetical protein
VSEPAETRQDASGEFPRELIDFLRAIPRLVVLKGRPRTGKTLFCLGLSEAVSAPQNTFMVCTRALEQQVYQSVPWLRTNEARDRSFEVLSQMAAPPTKKPPEPPTPPEQEARIRSAREMLRDILGEIPQAPPPEEEKEPEPEEDRSELAGLRSVIGDKNQRELQRVYQGLSRVPQDTPGVMVILDRADRLCEKNGLDMAALAGVMKADIFAKYGAHLVMVLDKPVPDLDVMADAIIVLKEAGQGEEFLGQLELARLGDQKIKTPKWRYNLRGGRFKVLPGMRVWGQDAQCCWSKGRKVRKGRSVRFVKRDVRVCNLRRRTGFRFPAFQKLPGPLRPSCPFSPIAPNVPCVPLAHCSAFSILKFHIMNLPTAASCGVSDG